MADDHITADLETKVEDAFLELLRAEAIPDGVNYYAWADTDKADPSVTVKAVRGESADEARGPHGDIMNVDVEITLRHQKGKPREWVLPIEKAIGCLYELPERLQKAAGKGALIFKDPNFLRGSKQLEGETVVRTLPLSIQAAHAPEPS